MAKKYILIKKTEAAELYVTELDSKITGEYSVEVFPVFSAFIEDATVYDDFDHALQVNLMIDSQCELREYKMRIGEIVLRSISFFLLLTVVLPLYFVTLIINAPLGILSNLLVYDNFKNYTLPDQILRTPGTGFNSIGFLKIWMIIVVPLINPFFETWGAYKKAKF